MKSAIFLACLGVLAPTQLMAIAKIIRHELFIQSHRPKTDWISVAGVGLLTASMVGVPIAMATIIFTRGK